MARPLKLSRKDIEIIAVLSALSAENKAFIEKTLQEPIPDAKIDEQRLKLKVKFLLLFSKIVSPTESLNKYEILELVGEPYTSASERYLRRFLDKELSICRRKVIIVKRGRGRPREPREVEPYEPVVSRMLEYQLNDEIITPQSNIQCKHVIDIITKFNEEIPSFRDLNKSLQDKLYLAFRNVHVNLIKYIINLLNGLSERIGAINYIIQHPVDEKNYEYFIRIFRRKKEFLNKLDNLLYVICSNLTQDNYEEIRKVLPDGSPF